MASDHHVYRGIYKQHHGIIPLDENGVSYHIHHIDGDRTNNSIDNLIALSIHEHYEIHYWQEDWAACQRLASLMILSPSEISRIASLNASKKIEDGTHHFLDGEFSRKIQAKRIEDGTHNFLDGDFQRLNNLIRVEDGTHHFLKKSDGTSIGAAIAREKVRDGTHNFLGPDAPSQQKWTCPYCSKSGKHTGSFTRWHKDGKCCKNTTKST